MMDRLPGTRNAAPNALNAPRDHQLLNVRGKSAGDRGGRKDSYADKEHESASKEIAQRTTNENQSSPKTVRTIRRPIAHRRRLRGALTREAGRATLTTVLSIKAMLEPRIVAARIHRPDCLVCGTLAVTDWTMASSHGGFMEIVSSPARR